MSHLVHIVVRFIRSLVYLQLQYVQLLYVENQGKNDIVALYAVALYAAALRRGVEVDFCLWEDAIV